MSLGSSVFPYESVSVFTAAEHPGYYHGLKCLGFVYSM